MRNKLVTLLFLTFISISSSFAGICVGGYSSLCSAYWQLTNQEIVVLAEIQPYQCHGYQAIIIDTLKGTPNNDTIIFYEGNGLTVNDMLFNVNNGDTLLLVLTPIITPPAIGNPLPLCDSLEQAGEYYFQGCRSTWFRYKSATVSGRIFDNFNHSTIPYKSLKDSTSTILTCNLYVKKLNVFYYDPLSNNSGAPFACDSSWIKFTIDTPNSVVWHNGSTDDTLSIFITTDTIITATITDTGGCVYTIPTFVEVIKQGRALPESMYICNDTCVEIFVDRYSSIYITGYTPQTTQSERIYTICPILDTTELQVVFGSTMPYQCMFTEKMTLYKVPPIVLSKTADTIISLGDSVQLLVSGGLTYGWSTGDSTPSIWVSPIKDSTFIIDVYDSVGCATQDSILVKVCLNNVVLNNFDVCENPTASNIIMASGMPAGGTYSGAIAGISFVGNTLQVATPLIPGNYSYYYTFADSNGCAQTDSAVFTITPIITPTLTSSGDTIFTSYVGDSTYWVFNGQITITTENYIVIDSSVSVQAYYEEGNCRSASSATFNHSAVGLLDIIRGDVKVYPTLFHDNLIIETQEPISYQLINVEDKVLASGIANNIHEINASPIASGMYFFVVQADENIQSIKLIKP